MNVALNSQRCAPRLDHEFTTRTHPGRRVKITAPNQIIQQRYEFTRMSGAFYCGRA